jgi:hypothetical protein
LATPRRGILISGHPARRGPLEEAGPGARLHVPLYGPCSEAMVWG